VDQSSRRRAAVLHVFSCLLFLGLVARLYWIQVRNHDHYQAELSKQSHGRDEVNLPPGPIYDGNGLPLAVSCPLEMAWANPSAIADKPAAAKLLAPALGMTEAEVLAKLSIPGRKFEVLKHKLSDEQAAAVRKLASEPPFKLERRANDQRLGLRTEYERQYPNGAVLSQLLGHDSAEPSQREGLERTLAQFLILPPKSVPVTYDGRRQMMGAPSLDLSGAEATLTINLLFQRVVEEELEAACVAHHPKWAVAVAMNPKTGEILALASRPTFDPNKFQTASADSRLNRVVSIPYEPGSTLKPFTCAAALDLDLVTPETVIDCEKGLWVVGSRRLHDHEPYSKLSVAEVIMYSSNIGAAKIGAQILGQKRLYECMKRWGFGERTGVDIPAEDSGLLFPLSRWTSFSETSVPMGHEISVTPLQLATAMSAIANGGTLYRPFVVRRVASTDGTLIVNNGPEAVRKVIGAKASRQMIEILKGVVKSGTGKKAAVEGIEVAGKTGTSQKIDPRTKQYTHEKYDASFVGFAPADDAKVCIAVVLDEPQGGSYYGGAVAAPVVGRILQRGLVYVK
jgi:cell division protein FtsI (penicillin-binding protein 3)